VLVTANNRVVDDTYPHYIALHYEAGFRAQRLLKRLSALTQADVQDMMALHADRVSIPAREFVHVLDGITPLNAWSSQATALLREWDGTMAPDNVAATIYAVWREHLMESLSAPLRQELAREVESGEPRGGLTHLGRLRARLTGMIQADERTLLPSGMDWPTVMGRALASAVAWLRQELGDDLQTWQWGRIHRTAPQHPLSALFPELAALLNPPSVAVGGDSDTVQAAGFPVGAGYYVHGTSVARYVFDLADWQRCLWSVPLGASGHPGSSHYADQAEAWAAVRSYPMLYDWAQISAEAETRQRLEPSPSGRGLG
jgi:penicillin G amidase